MASLNRDPNGNYTVQVVCGDGKRRSIRLGPINKKTATEIKLKVETLNALISANLPMDTETAQWVGRIGDDLAAKLAAMGLIPNRESRAVGEFLSAYLEQRRGDSKPATAVTIHRVVTDLTAFVGAATDLRAVTVEKAEGFKRVYQDKKLAPATVYRRLKMAKMLFGHAVKLKLIDANPFADVKSKNHNPPERRHYITPADTRKLLDAANPTWRTIIALSRFGGLRCPSEVLSLKWENVNLATGRMVVQSPKTEHLEGRSERVVPVFAVLRPSLEDAWELAAPGEQYVVGGTQGASYRKTAQGPNGWVNMNLRTTFEKLIRRAGLAAWPKVFHNMRASCETDLMANHPIHVVTAWIGNTPKIALGHYLQTLDGDFQKAVQGGAESGAVVVQNAVQSPTAANRQEVTAATEPLEISALQTSPVVGSHSLSIRSCGQGGTRNPAAITRDSKHIRRFPTPGGAESGAVAARTGRTRPRPRIRPRRRRVADASRPNPPRRSGSGWERDGSTSQLTPPASKVLPTAHQSARPLSERVGTKREFIYLVQLSYTSRDERERPPQRAHQRNPDEPAIRPATARGPSSTSLPGLFIPAANRSL